MPTACEPWPGKMRAVFKPGTPALGLSRPVHKLGAAHRPRARRLSTPPRTTAVDAIAQQVHRKRAEDPAMTHPYAALPAKAFWRSAVAGRSARGVEEVWAPRFAVTPTTPIATFGSCFAQHIGAALRARRFNWLQTEPPPRGLSSENAKAHGYEMFTCRTGNIYTARMLRQWTASALERASPQMVLGEQRPLFDPFRADDRARDSLLGARQRRCAPSPWKPSRGGVRNRGFSCSRSAHRGIRVTRRKTTNIRSIRKPARQLRPAGAQLSHADSRGFQDLAAAIDVIARPIRA